jgi:hypothetical protein
LARARQARRREELKELGLLMAMAYHKPKEIDKHLQPSIKETAHKAERDPDAWDQDEWWKNT